MSPVVAEELEKKLEEKGLLRLSQDKARELFDYRARKLVKMSGKTALKRIRAGKCGDNPAWQELISFSTLLR